MIIEFPNKEWVEGFKNKLNTDENYARIAKNWEGDFLFQVEPDDKSGERTLIYLDLWHGTCRDAYFVDQAKVSELKPAFTFIAPYSKFLDVVEGRLDPMQAMITRKLKVTGSMALLMRNVPVVLDFVRCAREID